MKTNKKQLENALSVRKDFLVDLTWRMGSICQFSLGFLQESSRLHEKIILSDAAFLVQKTQCQRITLNKVNNYGLRYFFLL